MWPMATPACHARPISERPPTIYTTTARMPSNTSIWATLAAPRTGTKIKFSSLCKLGAANSYVAFKWNEPFYVNCSISSFPAKLCMSAHDHSSDDNVITIMTSNTSSASSAGLYKHQVMQYLLQAPTFTGETFMLPTNQLQIQGQPKLLSWKVHWYLIINVHHVPSKFLLPVVDELCPNICRT